MTGGTVIPSGNPLDVLRRDHHAVKRRIITSSLREGKLWLIKPGQRMLSSLGRRIVYEKETRTRKPTLKSDTQSHMAHNGSATQFTPWIENSMSYCDGVMTVESRRAGGVPGPVHQRAHPKRLVVTPSRCKEPGLGAEGKCYWPEKNKTLIKPQDHSTVYSGMQRGSTTRRFRLRGDCIGKILMWPAPRKHT